MKEECDRVRSLKGRCLPWYIHTRPTDETWIDDSIKMMKGLGGAKGNRLVEAGIETVGDIKVLGDNDLHTLASSISSISLAFLTQLRDAPSHPGSCPHQPIDYKREKNPYLARYGISWEDEIKKTIS